MSKFCNISAKYVPAFLEWLSQSGLYLLKSLSYATPQGTTEKLVDLILFAICIFQMELGPLKLS